MTFMASEALGTVDYMSPEQMKGRRGDRRMDIYSLGAILYEMTTGRVPYDDQPDDYSKMKARLVGDPVAPRIHNPDLTTQVEEIVLHALARDPADRYQSASELRADVVDPCHVRLAGRANRLQRPRVRSRHWKIAAVLIGAALAPIALFLLLFLVLR